MTHTQRCSNPSCPREIYGCFGTAKAGDIVEAYDGKRPWHAVRQLCPHCATKAIRVLEGASTAERLAYFATIGWGEEPVLKVLE